jgi:hypothetical protein
MTWRVKLLLSVGLVAMAALPAAPAAAQFSPEENPIDVQDFKVLRSTKQAGAHPRVDIRMRFCNAGTEIVNVTGQGVQVVITTAEDHGVANNGLIRVLYVKGNTAAVGKFRALTTGSTVDGHVLGPREIALRTSSGTPIIGNGDWIPDPEGPPELHTQQNSLDTTKNSFGCIGAPSTALVRDFTLKFPPGFIGNPSAVTPCPTFIYLAGACTVQSQVGHVFAEPVSGQPGAIVDVPTSIYIIETMGLEPARLGTETVPAFPPGPISATVALRTAGPEGDYGINSTTVNIPKDLGASAGTVRNLHIVLCERAPCTTTVRANPQSIAPIEPAKPFFVNPTSCGTSTARVHARSWFLGDPARPGFENGDPGDEVTYPLETIGCDQPTCDQADGTTTTTPCNPPFEAGVSIDSANSTPGASDRQTVRIKYPRGPARTDAEGRVWGCADPPAEPGCSYDWDEIWQAALKDADVTLPPGMGLAPGGGNGLQECSFTQFGVDPSTGKQLNDDPAKCPEGAHVGNVEVVTPALPTTTNADGEPVSITGKAFFGPTGAPGRPTPANPWKLFLLLEGHGLRIKLVGDVSLTDSGQVRTVFQNQPEVPFGEFRLKMGDSNRAVLLQPLQCGTHSGTADLTGHNDTHNVTNPSVTSDGTCGTFSVNIDEASAQPEQAGAHSISKIRISRTDPSDMLTGLKLSLPPGAAGSLSGVPKCPLAQALAGNCPNSTLVGNLKTTLGSGVSLFTVPGKLFLAEPAQAGDVASIIATVPAKAGVPDPQTGKYPIDLGPDVVIVNRLLLREADTGVDVIGGGAYQGGRRIAEGVPSLLEGVPLPIRQIEITVDREGFFLNPTGCDPRPVVGTFTSASGLTTTSSFMTQAKGCESLPFNPTLYMIVGEAGKTRAGQDVHPPLTAIVTQKAGEASISRARVLVPDIVRPNVPFLNEPGALCNDAQAQARTCPAKSLVGSARVITPVLPFELNGPVHIVQEIGNILPKLYVYLRGGGFEVLLKARNRITGVRTENTFDFVPDVPQSYFELKIKAARTGC